MFAVMKVSICSIKNWQRICLYNEGLLYLHNSAMDIWESLKPCNLYQNLSLRISLLQTHFKNVCNKSADFQMVPLGTRGGVDHKQRRMYLWQHVPPIYPTELFWKDPLMFLWSAASVSFTKPSALRDKFVQSISVSWKLCHVKNR